MPPNSIQPLLARFAALVAETREALRAIDATQRHRVGLRAIGAFIWLEKLSYCLATLIHRFQSGRLRPLRLATCETSPGACRSRLEIPRPRGKAWLLRVLGEAGLLAAAFETLLAHPDFQAPFAQEPARFRRLLAPFCRAMGIALPEQLAAPIRRVIPPALVATMAAVAAAATPQAAVAILLQRSAAAAPAPAQQPARPIPPAKNP